MSELQDTVLLAALADIERHVTSAGWDQPARLFALVPTVELIAAEPSLAEQFGGRPADALSAVEQEGFHAGEDLLIALAHIAWPPTVAGCALAVERTFLPQTFEADIPQEPQAAARFVHDHPQRQDVRVVVGVLRSGAKHGLARLVSAPDELLGADDLVPSLAAALFQTLTDGGDDG